MYITKSF